MRVTKAMLLERVAAMESFMRKAIVCCEDEASVRNSKGFIPVEQYTYGVPFEDELGMLNGVRVLRKPLDKWEFK